MAPVPCEDRCWLGATRVDEFDVREHGLEHHEARLAALELECRRRRLAAAAWATEEHRVGELDLAQDGMAGQGGARAVSASPTAWLARGYRRAGAQIDRLGREL